jgi:hypothetical protein
LFLGKNEDLARYIENVAFVSVEKRNLQNQVMRDPQGNIIYEFFFPIVGFAQMLESLNLLKLDV